MGLGLNLYGKIAAKGKSAKEGDLLDPLVQWWEQHGPKPFTKIVRGKDGDGNAIAGVEVYYPAEMIELRQVGKREITIYCGTNQAGPGFHIWLVGMIKQMGDVVGIDWLEVEDETGFWESNDIEAVKEAMRSWLAEIMQVVLGSGAFAPPLLLSMPVSDTKYLETDPILTALGPRTIDWAKQVADNPESGKDFFAWFNDGTLDGAARLGWAKGLMWKDVRWRKPIFPEERETMEKIVALLAEAHHLDPSLDFPWREWLEIALALGQHGEFVDSLTVQANALDTSKRMIGYLRGDVEEPVSDQWKIRCPGALGFVPDEDHWCVRDDYRAIRVTPFMLPDQRSADKLSDPKTAREIMMKLCNGRQHQGESEMVTLARDGEVRFGWFGLSKDVPNEWILNTINQAGLNVAVLTIAIDNVNDRQWAIDTWRSLECTAKLDEK